MARLLSLPISARLALWYALTLLLLLSGFAVFCYLGFHAAAHRSFDRHLDHEMGAVAPLLRVRAGGVGRGALERGSAAMRLDGPNGTFVRVLGRTARVQVPVAQLRRASRRSAWCSRRARAAATEQGVGGRAGRGRWFSRSFPAGASGLRRGVGRSSGADTRASATWGGCWRWAWG